MEVVHGELAHLPYAQPRSSFTLFAGLTHTKGADGSRKPTDLELKIAEIQGRSFYEKVSRVQFQ